MNWGDLRLVCLLIYVDRKSWTIYIPMRCVYLLLFPRSIMGLDSRQTNLPERLGRASTKYRLIQVTTSVHLGLTT